MNGIDLGPASCSNCRNYLRERRDVLEPHIVAKAGRDDSLIGLTWLDYMQGVHRRHLSGFSLGASA